MKATELNFYSDSIFCEATTLSGGVRTFQEVGVESPCPEAPWSLKTSCPVTGKVRLCCCLVDSEWSYYYAGVRLMDSDIKLYITFSGIIVYDGCVEGKHIYVEHTVGQWKSFVYQLWQITSLSW